MNPVRQKVELDYGTPPVRPMRRNLRRAAIGVTVLVAGVMAVKMVTPRVVERGRPHWVAYDGQRKVEAVIAPPGAVLYSEEPAEIARLTGQAQYELRTADGGGTGMPTVARLSASYSDPQQLEVSYRSGMAPIGLRRVPGGPWRLINLNGGQYGTQPDGSRNALFPTYDVRTRATFQAAARPKQLWYGMNRLTLAPTDRVTILAGQLDPADESRFTFDYTLNGAPGTVDGHLGADDNVTFTIRSGPATTMPYTPRSGRQNFP
ncbi:MAG TPA: hypothetical protein VGN72_02145 [Tepidisphaeraceae bacterium]|jgi:hypothetical protein|nr:hypothetical protein [Tepidisphaeraceae bacterium]